jgi:hypothetical protein
MSPTEDFAVTKFAVRLVPFLALMFFINYLDRTAISFAGPNGMNQDLGLSSRPIWICLRDFLYRLHNPGGSK